MKERGVVRGWIKLDHYDKDGNLIESINTPNTMTNDSFEEISGLFCSDTAGSYTAFDYIALGTGTTAAAATDTELESEITDDGGQRSAATGTQVTTTVTNDTAQFVNTFSFTGSKAVTESGVLNAGAAGTLCCRQTFSAINVANGDSLQVTWKVAVS